MPKIIADIYEIQNQIGAGGGGIVYLGRHLRLNEKIVLKADKRSLNTKMELLRREVDMLKNLSHTYIPQVYDFVEEDGVFYTIMAYIEGESLDQVLKRSQKIKQSQIIQWACELLEALNYLHTRPPYGIIHGDIKPANIMLRPDGNICLIDYNIALALGENGAVKAGFSRGYASPEHYGIEYINPKNPIIVEQSLKEVPNCETTEITQTSVTIDDTEEAMDMTNFPDKTETLELSGVSGERETIEISYFPQQTEIQGKTETQTIGNRNLSNSAEQIGHSQDLGKSPLSAGNLSSTSSRQGVMLDVRSDIYSLGATLYHLLSGQRPAQSALEVKPLGTEVCSAAVSEIIQKAMAFNPDMRYQSAQEMLTAFKELHRRDIRIIRHKRRIVISAVLLSVIFLSGGTSTFAGMKQLEQIQESLALAEYSSNHLAQGDVSDAIKLALQAIPAGKNFLDAPVTAQAQKALTDALGVYDLSDGFKTIDTIELSSAPFTITMSPEGTYCAAVCQNEVIVFDMESGERVAQLDAQNSALSDVIFIDENKIVYAGVQGVTAYDLNMQKVLWTGEEATTLAISGDKTVMAAVNRNEDYAIIYRISNGEKIRECSFKGNQMQVAVNDIFANPHNRIFSLNQNGSLLAVSFSGGALRIFDLENSDEDMIIYEETAYGHFEGGFCGKYFAFAADKNDESLFGLVNTEEGVYVGVVESRDQFFLKTDEQNIYLTNKNLLVSLDPDTLEQKELAYTNDVNITGFSIGDGYVIVATDDKKFSFYDGGANLISSELCKEPCNFVAMAGKYAVVSNRNESSVRFLKRESHEDTQIAFYDSRYIHDEARISQDGTTTMLFGYENFCIYNKEGIPLIKVELPEPESIYDQQFRKTEDGSWLEVIWYDGTIRCYSASDGSVISETKGEAPDKDLYEEFYTNQYKIVSSLHGSPEVYDLQSNQKVAVLEEDAYLTYVTQVGEYIVTEYVSAAGEKYGQERYGLLLDSRLQTLARLPGLCDVSDETFIFDYGSGNLRQCRLYSLQELIALGEAYLQNEKGEKG